MKRLLFLAVLLSAMTTVVSAGQFSKRLLGIGTPPPPAPSTGNADAFFDDTVVHDIFLAINTKDWQSLRDNFLDNTYYPCDFTWRGQVVRNIGIRSRGTGSRSGAKPGLRVDFDRYVDGQTFQGLKSFILRNQTQDASNLHERLSMLLFGRLGMVTLREAHAKLYINGAYAGLYTLVESVDKTFLQRSYNENDGYLYKYDYPPGAPPYYFDDLGSNPASYVPLPFKPETHETDPRPEGIVDLVQTLNQTSDASFKSVMASYIDLTKFLRHVAIERFIADTDGFVSEYGGMNNYYFYRFVNQKLFTFIPWDKSEAFKGGPQYPIFRNITDVPDTQKNKLLKRALSFPDLYSVYLNALIDCVNSANEKVPGSADQRGWLEREIEREYNQIHDAALTDPQKTFSNAEFEQAVKDLTAFAQQRGAFVSSAVAAAR